MAKPRPLNRHKMGTYLVTDGAGDPQYRDEVDWGITPEQRGHLWKPEDIDQLGHSDLLRLKGRGRGESLIPGKRTGPQRQTWRVRDENGDLV